MMLRMLGLIITFILILAALKILVVFLEPSMTFHPLPGETRTPKDAGVDFQRLHLRTDDGETVHAWWIEAPASRATVLFFHGNAGNLSTWMDLLLEIQDRSLNVLALDYRGFGLSTGRPSEEGLYRDCDALLDYFCNELREPSVPVIYWGRSLGGVAASYSASRRAPDGLILEATFPDKASLLNHYPVLKVLAVFSRYRLPTAEFLKSFDGPALILHGDQDSLIPADLGRRLAETGPIASRRRLAIIQGAGHNDLEQVGGENYWKWIQDFIEEIKDGQDPTS